MQGDMATHAKSIVSKWITHKAYIGIDPIVKSHVFLDLVDAQASSLDVLSHNKGWEAYKNQGDVVDRKHDMSNQGYAPTSFVIIIYTPYAHSFVIWS